MKKLVLIVFISQLLYSCGGSIGSTGISNVVEQPLPTATVQGSVVLYNEAGGIVSNASGVTVSVDSTTYTTTTDSSGVYVLKNVPQEEYTITYSKNGYSIYKNINANITAGKAPITYSPVSLYAPSTTYITNLAVAPYNGASGAYNFYGIVNPSGTKAFPKNVAIFMGLSSTVSPTNYMAFVQATADSSVLNVNSNLYTYFASGSTVYMVAYGITTFNSYTNPASGFPVYYGGVGATPSNVFPVTLP